VKSRLVAAESRGYNCRMKEPPRILRDVRGPTFQGVWILFFQDPGDSVPCAAQLELAQNVTFRELTFFRRIDAMSARLLVGITAMAGVSACGFISTLVYSKMVDQVNGRLPKDAQFSPLGRYPSKTLRLHREYRRLFPDGGLLLQVRFVIAVGFGSLIVCAWALCFFGK